MKMGQGSRIDLQIFKDLFQKAQQLTIPRSKKSGEEDKRVARLSTELRATLKGKKLMCRQWKQGQITSEEYRDEVQLFKDGVRKAKVKLKVDLAKDAKNNKKASTSMLTRKGRSKVVYPLTNSSGKLVATDEEQAQVVNTFFASVFSGSLSSHTSRVDGEQHGSCRSKVPPTGGRQVREDQACGHLRNLHVHRSMTG